MLLPKSILAMAGCLLTTYVALVLTAHTQAAQIAPGKPLPNLSSFGLEGALPSTKGKVVLIDFWASWCAPCKASFPTMNDLQKKFGKDRLVILAVNVDEKKADMDAFLKKTPVAFTVVRDPGHKLVAASAVETMPTSFIVGPDGIVKSRHSGFRGAKTAAQYEAEIQALLP